MPTLFQDSDSGAGTLFTQYKITDGSPSVNNPGNQNAIYNVASTLDLGGSDYLSARVQPAVSGFTCDNSGVLSFDGSRTVPSFQEITVEFWENGDYSGLTTSITFTYRLNLPVPATINYGDRGFATTPNGLLEKNGIEGDGTGLDSCEITNVSAGASGTITPGGVLEAMLDAEGSYTFDWCYWDGTTLTTGQEVVTVNVTVAPVFVGNIANQSWEVGVAVDLSLADEFDPTPDSYLALDDALPAGLQIQSGRIVGTPTTETPLGNMRFRGSNSEGADDTNQFTYVVASGAAQAPNFTGTIPNQTDWQEGVAIAAIDLSAYFDPDPSAYSALLDAVPVGLSINNGVLEGTPGQAGSGNLAFRGSNAAGSDDTNAFSYVIAAAQGDAPEFTGAIPTQSWQVGVAITPINFADYFNPDPTDYTNILDALPDGLSIISGTLTGTPTAVGSGTLQVNGENADGDDDTNQFAYTIVSANTYPSLYQEVPTITPLNAKELSLTDDGGARFVGSATEETFRITFVHKGLLESEWLQLLSFYEANKDNRIIFNAVIEGGVYDADFQARPIPRNRSATRIDVTVTLIGTRQ